MPEGKIKQVFPGGITPQGFFSYYDYILGQEEAERILVIKGGPGVGKSTFMRKIGEEIRSRGYDVEYMHCSSDNSSLDGVVIPAIRVAMLDGTAPHVVDPKNPGAVDEIIHLGDYWDERKMRENRDSIIQCNREVGRIFARAYKYIKAASLLYEDTADICGRAVDSAKVNAVSKKVVDDLFGRKGVAVTAGKERRLFASAITPDGLKNYLSTVLTTGRLYTIKGKPGTGTDKLLEKVKTAALEAGYNTEAYFCVLNPHRLEHLVIPEMDVSFTTSNEYHSAERVADVEIDLDEYLDSSVLEAYTDVLDFNRKEFEKLLLRTIFTIKKAKLTHDLMEKYYIPNMDFAAIDAVREKTLERILEYASLAGMQS